LVVDSLAPATAGALEPMYDAAAAGRLQMPFCASCRIALELEQLVCDRCGSGGPQWQEVEPRGTVHAVTTVHRHEPSLIRAREPYSILDVELESGHRIIMTTTAPVGGYAVGDAVAVTFRTVGDVAIPAVSATPPVWAHDLPVQPGDDSAESTTKEHR